MADFGVLYDAITDDAAFAALPQAVARHVDSRSVTVQAFGPRFSLDSLNYVYFTAEMDAYYRQHELHHTDIWSKGIITNLDKGAQCFDELVSENEYRKSPFYNEFFRHFGDDTGHCMGFAATVGTRVITVGAHRPFSAGAFDARAVRRMDQIMPHVTRIYRARFALLEAREAALDAEELCWATASAAIMADSWARAIGFSPSARTLLAHGDGLSLSIDCRLQAERHSQTAQLEHLIASACDNRPPNGGALMIERGSGKPALRVLITPCPHRPGRALVLADDPDTLPVSPAGVLIALYDLTTAEAEVAELLARGSAPAAIAELREVSLTTVRAQIQQCLRKTDTLRQTEFVALVNRLPKSPEGGSAAT
jgi:DNA-binding CsgD family transcriptional regulator